MTDELKDGLVKLVSLKNLPEKLRQPLVKDFVFWSWTAGPRRARRPSRSLTM